MTSAISDVVILGEEEQNAAGHPHFSLPAFMVPNANCFSSNGPRKCKCWKELIVRSKKIELIGCGIVMLSIVYLAYVSCFSTWAAFKRGRRQLPELPSQEGWNPQLLQLLLKLCGVSYMDQHPILYQLSVSFPRCGQNLSIEVARVAVGS